MKLKAAGVQGAVDADRYRIAEGRRRSRRATWAGVGLAATMLAMQAPALADQAQPTPAALVAARELFREATDDFEGKRFEAALAKFRRVAQVKDTPQVRFNIAKSEEALGHVGAALVEYEAAERLTARDADSKTAALRELAKSHANALRARVPRLVIEAPDAPTSLRIQLDGSDIGSGTLGVPLPVDPGRHTIQASANESRFSQEITLAERQTETVRIHLEGAQRPTPSPDAPNVVVARADDQTQGATSWFTVKRTAGLVSVAAGVALGIVSLVKVAEHNGLVSDIRESCSPRCPSSRRSELEQIRSDAVSSETMATMFGVGSVLALGAGAALLVWPEPKAIAWSPGAPGTVVGASWSARF